jgi:hypothetical protein
MYMFIESMYINVKLCNMRTAGKRLTHKHFRLDNRKLKRAQKLLQATTETEAIDRALDLAIAEKERNLAALQANERFLRSGIEIQDVFGRLDD